MYVVFKNRRANTNVWAPAEEGTTTSQFSTRPVDLWSPPLLPRPPQKFLLSWFLGSVPPAFLYSLSYYFALSQLTVFSGWVFVAALGLSSCIKQGLLFVAVRGLLIAVTPLVSEHRLEGTRAQYLWHTGLVATWPVGSSWTRDRTHVTCIDR